MIVTSVSIGGSEIEKNKEVFARITYKSNGCPFSTLQPTVVITSPQDGSVVNDPHLVVLGYASDERGMNYWEWEWHWKDGSYSNSSYFQVAEYVEFRIDIYGLHPGWNLIIVRFKNIYGAWGEDSVNVTYNPPNTPPNTPSKPEGPTKGKVKETLHFNTVTTDPDGDSLEYLIDWGDGTNTGWLGPITSGIPFETFHSWDEPGTYAVKAKARDLPYLEESDWSDSLIVTISENDIESPVVVIEYPEDGATFTEPDITVTGHITDNVGIVSYGYTHEWNGGSTGSSWPLEEPTSDYSFEIPITLHEGWNRIKVEASDAAGNPGYDEKTIYYNIGNNPPNKPAKPSGPTNGKTGVTYTYSTTTTDPDGDQIYYLFDWGDGTNSGWLGPYNSSQTVSASHSWNEKGSYQIKVKAKDIYGEESEWSDPLPVTMPRNKNIYNILERITELLPLLKHLLNIQ